MSQQYCNEENMRATMREMELSGHFDMAHWVDHPTWGRIINGETSGLLTDCGSAACIGGHASVLMARKHILPIAQYKMEAYTHDISQAAGDWLGLHDQLRKELFYMDSLDPVGFILDEEHDRNLLSMVSLEDALQACQNVIDQGKPCWGEIMADKIKDEYDIDVWEHVI